MRLALVVNTYPPRVGGLETHVSHLSKELSAAGHEVHVLTLGDRAGAHTDHGIRVLTGHCHLHVTDVITFPSLGATHLITSYLRRLRIDLVSTHTRFFPMSYVGVRAARGAGIPVIHTEHGSDFVVSSNPAIFLGSRAVDLSMGHYVLRRAQRVLAVSPQAAAFAKRLGAAQAEVFYNAVPTPQPRRQPVADRPEHLVFVGRMVPGKGWDTFLDAVAALRSRGRPVTGEMLGDGMQIDQARRRLVELGLERAVSLRGWVQPDQVRQALAGATLVNPTVLAEGFQTTLLESVGESGRVVTFDVPGAHLLAQQGAPVVVCPERTTAALASAVDRMLEDPPPPGGPDLITPWTWPVRARQYARIAQEVIDRYRCQAPRRRAA